MRYAIILATSLGFIGAAIAAEGPTKAQCDGGWKDNYSAKWTPAAFKKACDAMK